MENYTYILYLFDPINNKRSPTTAIAAIKLLLYIFRKSALRQNLQIKEIPNVSCDNFDVVR